MPRLFAATAVEFDDIDDIVASRTGSRAPSMQNDPIRPVLRHYHEPFASAPLVEHRSSGLSGARLWRCDIAAGPYVLRRWPDGQMSAPRLEWIHRLLFRAPSETVPFLPLPVVSRNGSTYLEFDDAFWQLEPWMPGEADLADPPRFEKVAAAVEALARFHDAVSGEPLERATRLGHVKRGRSPACRQRAELLDEMLAGGIDQIRIAPAFVAPSEPWSGIAVAAVRWLTELPRRAAALRIELAEPSAIERTLRPVLRDITRDHVLFTRAKVTGIVDFGAMAEDHVTVDLARLGGSYGGGASIFEHIWQVYQSTKPGPSLTEDDRRLMILLDRSGVLVSAYRWLRWIFVERRSFADPEAVSRRIAHLMARDATLGPPTF